MTTCKQLACSLPIALRSIENNVLEPTADLVASRDQTLRQLVDMVLNPSSIWVQKVADHEDCLLDGAF